MSTRYGCCSQEAILFLEQKFDYRIEDKIDDIVNNWAYPREYTIQDVNSVINVMKDYPIQKRKQIGNYYDTNYKKLYTNIYYLHNTTMISADKIRKIINIVNKLIVKLKIKFNRARPFQISQLFKKNINPVSLITTHTPSYPSGHTAGFYALYKYFSSKDRINEKKYKKIYKNGSKSRIISGVHFLIDNEASIQAVNLLWPTLLNFI